MVHGGGAAIAKLAAALGIEEHKVDGLRVTDAATAEVALAVLAGTQGKSLAAALGRQYNGASPLLPRKSLMALDAPPATGWRRPEVLLLVATAAAPFAWATWQALLNNFAIERAAFTGAEIGILQSLREVPGFLAFTVVFLLLIVREQRLAFLTLRGGYSLSTDGLTSVAAGLGLGLGPVKFEVGAGRFSGTLNGVDYDGAQATIALAVRGGGS